MTDKNESKTQKKLKDKKDTLMTFLNKIYLGEETYSNISHKIINATKVFIVSTRKFIIDDCFTKASSITYTIILSLIPALTVALTFYSIFSGVGGKKEELFRRISLFMLEHNIKINIDPVFAAISGLIENAGKIGGISAVIMIFSATAMLRSLEKSLNSIWKVKKGRPIFLKIIYYWAALTLGPVMLIAGTSVATQLSIQLSSPNYNSAHITNNKKVWVVGNKATILQSCKGDLKFKKISMDSNNIDFDNQKVYKYDTASKTFKEQDIRIEPLEFEKTKFKDVQFIENNGWIVGNDGTILYTTDGGSSWLIKKFHSYNFNDIHMIDANRGFIAAESGIILSTNNSGSSWEVKEWKGITSNFNSISFYKNKGIITGNRGIILSTDDMGETWELKYIRTAKRKNRLVNLNNSCFANDKHVWLLGNEGIILRSSDGGKTWISKKFKENNYHAAYFFNKSEGFAAGNNGRIIYTKNGGDSWESKKLPAYRIKSLLYKDNRLWAIGDAGMIMVSKDKGKNWEGIKGKSFILAIINFLAPFAFIWLLFLLAYITIPNTKVPFKPASIGAIFTGAVWVIFILLFIVYIKSFAKGTFAIYGTLAAIPLFLLMIYASSMIILLGAEIAYTLMHPETYRNLKKAFQDKNELHLYYGISLLHLIYKKFEKGKGATTPKELLKISSNKSEEIEIYTQLFIDEKFITRNSDNSLTPANSSYNIKLIDVIDSILQIGLSIPVKVGKSPLKNFMSRLFDDIISSRRRIVGDMTMKDLIEKG